MGIPDGSVQSIDKARQLLGEGKPADAEPILRALLEIQPNEAETNALLSAALSMTGRAQESITFVERAVGLDPTKASYVYNLGAMVERTGDTARALECYRRAVELDPNYARAAEALQRLYRAGQTTTGPATSPTQTQAPLTGYPASPPVMTDLAGNPIEATPPPKTHTPAPYGAPQQPSVYGTPGAMPGPYTSAYAQSGGNYAMAPQIVKSTRFADIFFGALWAFVGFVFAMIALTSPNSKDRGLLLLFAVVFYGGASALCFWLASALRRGVSASWTVQLMQSVLCLVFFPIGTLISILILASWFKPETKAWFGRT